jgi:hydroxylamine dehydrogenase
MFTMHKRLLTAALLLTGSTWATALQGAAIGLPELSEKSARCVACHKKLNRALYQQWGSSKHFRGNVGCYECHMAKEGEADAHEHFEELISTIVSPKDCARCHEKEVQEFADSHHAKAGRIQGSLEHVLAEVVEGNHGLKTDAFPQGVSAAAVNGCWQCHGAEVKVLADGLLDAATWPNTGVGRLNPDGSEGSCAACHSRHSFSVAQARQPETCGKCHLGPNHPQIEIYNESKHGVAYHTNKDKMNLDSPKWIPGEDYSVAPTCATCHMSATMTQPVTHNVGKRISWNNRPVVSIRPEQADAKMNLPGMNLMWRDRRANMKDVCISCHSNAWIDNWYEQYDGLIELYNNKFAKPGQALYQASMPLRNPVKFSNKIDFTWFELWHHEGRRARHGASMMGPNYTNLHGTYEVAKNFYTKFIPELEGLIEKGRNSPDEEQNIAAENLATLLQDVLSSDDHKWFVGRMSPEEKAAREKAAAEFKARYE